MSKERLEEIISKAIITKSKYPVINGNARPGEAKAEYKEVVQNLSEGDFDYILQRVEELEEEIQGWKNIAKLRQGKQKEAEDKNEPYRHLNKRYKQALEEIAYADWDMTHYEYSLLVSRISRQTLEADKP